MANENLLKYLSDKRIKDAEARQKTAETFARIRENQLYQNQLKDYEAQQAEQLKQQQERESAGLGTKLWQTALDVPTELVGGLGKGVEGVVDALLSISNIPFIGTGWYIEQLIGNDQLVEDIIKFNATDEWWYSWEDKLTENSYMNDAPIVKDVVRGIGQQLPTIAAIAASPFTGGASLAAVPYLQGAQAVSAGGQGVEEALNDDATFGQAFAYGTMQGGIEYLLEKIPLGTGKIAKTVVKEGTQEAAKSVGKHIGREMLGEALQETIQEGTSALLNPATKTVYKGSEALEEYANPEFYKDVGYQALVGGITGGLTAGASGGLSVRAGIKESGGKSQFLVSQSASELRALDTKEDNLRARGKFDAKQQADFDTSRKAETENISAQLKSMDEAARQKAIKDYGLQNDFAPDGSVIAPYATESTEGGNNTADTVNAPRKPYKGDNRDAYSASLRNTALKVAPTSKPLTEAGIAAKNIMTKLGKANDKTRFVITEAGEYNGHKFDAFYDSESGVIYVNNNADAEAVRKRVVVHEITHSMEGTRAYSNLIKYVQESNLTTKDGKNFADLVAEARAIYAKTVTGKSDGTKQYVYETEALANLMGELLSNEKSIARLAASQKGTTYRIYSWVKDALSRLAKSGDTKSAEYKTLRNIERLYSKAMSEAAGGVSLAEVERYFKEVAEAEETKKENVNTSEKNNSGNVSDKDVRYSLQADSEGKKLTEAQAEFFKDSKVRDEDGNLLVVYHGTTEQFNAFDMSKGRTNMDIQGAFFSPWELDAKGYGDSVRAFYLNITNPAGEAKGYAALRKFQGENNAGVKAREYLKSLGYDGVNNGNEEYIAFYPEQIKLITNKNPTGDSDIRYSLNDGKGDYDYSKGEIAKYIANRSKKKVYSRTEAEQIINTLVSNQLSFGYKYGEIRGKTKAQVVDMLWHKLNTKDEGYRGGAALDIAEYLIDNVAMESVFADKSHEAEKLIVDTLRPYIRNVNLDSAALKSEISHRYGSDKTIYSRWGKRKGTTTASAPDQIAMEIKERGINITAENPADILFEMNDMYQAALDSMKKSSKESLADVVKGEKDREALKQGIARDILNGWDEYGTKTEFAKFVEKQAKEKAFLKNALAQEKARNSVTGQILASAEMAREIKGRKYSDGAGILANEETRAFVDALAGFSRRNSKVIAGDIRDRVRALKGIYNKENAVLMGDDEGRSYYDNDIASAIDRIISKESRIPLDASDLEDLHIISKGILYLHRTYDRFIGDAWKATVTDAAIDGLEVVQKTARMKRELGSFAQPINRLNNSVILQLIDPSTVIEAIDMFDENGIVTKAYRAIEAGDIQAQVAYAEIMSKLDDFYDKHKGYKQRLANDKHSIQVKVKGGEVDLTLRQAIQLYMTSKREQANLFAAGFKINQDGVRTHYDIEQHNIDELYSKLTKEDKEFIELARKIFNEDARALKENTDNEYKGYTSLEDTDWYIPVKRSESNVAKDLGGYRGYVNDIQTADNKSFNKRTSQNVTIPVEIGDGILSVLEHHVMGVSVYSGLAVPLKNFGKVWNKRIGEKGSRKTSIKEIVKDKVWNGSENYINKLMNDIQGVGKNIDGGDKLLLKFRSAYAKFQLGANLGTVLKQTASWGMAYTYLDADALAKGFAMKLDKAVMFKYAPITKARMYNKTVVKAQGLVENVGTIGDIATKPIQLMDDAVIGRLWGAAQVQVQKDTGLKIGTEENLKEAGKLLDKVVRKTQSNSIMSERSGLSRHNSILISSLAMFGSDAQKQFSRIYESTTRLHALKWRIKSGETGLATQYKDAKKQLMRSYAGVTASAVMVAMISAAMRWLLGKKDEEESFVNRLGQDMFGQFVGMLPLVRDIYGKLSEGYEINNYAIGMLDDTATAVKGIWTMGSKIVNGEPMDANEIAKPIRDMLYGVGQFTGIPFRNVYNLVYGMIEKFSPASALEMNSVFYGTGGYSKSLQNAINKGDDKQAELIINLMLGDRTGKIKDDTVLSTMRDLISQGHNVLPRSLGDSVTYNGEKIELTQKQRTAFQKIYTGANDKVKAMVSSKLFGSLDNAAKAKAIKFIYDYYYNLGLGDLLGEDLESKNILFGAGIPIEQLAMAIAQAQQYEADTDRTGKIVSGSRKAKVQGFIQGLSLTAAQKYMIMGYLGYTNANGATQVKSYINSLKLSKTQKEALYVMSGYKLKSGAA